MIYNGTDPGFTGALGFIEEVEGEELAQVFDMPIRLHNGHKRVDRPVVKQIVRRVLGAGRIISAVEAVSAMGGKTNKDGTARREGAQSMFRFGQGQGEVLGVMECYSEHVFEADKAVWKVKCGLSKMSEKEVCKLAASMWPNLVFFGPKGGPLHGRAEAMFLARWARKLVTGKGIYDR